MELMLQGNDMAEMYALYEALDAEVAQVDAGQGVSVSEPMEPLEDVTYRGDAGSLVTVAVAAVGAGGALTVLISSIANVIAKHLETRKADLLIEKEGQKIQIKGSAKEIQAILEQLNR